MNKRQWSAVSGLAVGALVATGFAVPIQAQAAPTAKASVQQDPAAKQASRPDNLPNPLAEAQAKARQEAIAQLVKGEAKVRTINGNRVIELKAKGKNKKGKYVNYPVNREEDIFTILTDFGDTTDPRTGGEAGPVHNQIPSPDRKWDGNTTDNNSTYWTANFDRQHYVNMMFGQGESFRDFYLKQSNGRFLAKGDVSDWVTVPYNESRYGRNNISESDGYWNYIKDTAQAWYDGQKKVGKTDAEIADYLKQFDKVDRYDYDGDGNFNEPDGYIDHFQAIHAGEGEEAGGGAEGDDAIWSHRWYAYSNQIGKTGPDFNQAGGVPVGNTGLWIGDYTTEPENGGLGVFSHEFGHDLGLADYYDTSGGDNGTGFWTLMSAGSWLNEGKDAIGTKPGYMGPHEKLLLGWLDYTVADQSGRYALTPADKGSAERTQAVVMPLKDKTTTTKYNTPHAGSNEWWSGSANNLASTLQRSLDLTGSTSASLNAWTWYNTEEDYDLWFVEASADGGKTWADLTDGGISGSSESWTQLSWDLSAFAGKKVDVRFRYATDGGLSMKGLFLDDISVVADGTTVLTDDVESADHGWTTKGFSRITGTVTKSTANYYIFENRVYSGYDRYLKSGPYNFGFLNTMGDWVERFPYQNGMLVWYVDDSYVDNNTRLHPGAGMALPVDARPAPVRFYDGSLLGNRRQPFDATFGLEKTDRVTFHKNGKAVMVDKQAAVPTFDDSYSTKYWTADNPMGSVKTAASGAKVTVVKAMGSDGERLVLDVTAPKK